MNNWWARAKIIGSLAALVGSFALSAVTWIGIGGITGYGDLRVIMPLVVDAYIVTAIAIGMSSDIPRVARSAYYHALSAAIIGTVAQAVYHCASVWSERHIAWMALLAFVGGGLPPSFAFLGVHLLGMDQREQSEISSMPDSGGEDSHVTQEASASGWLDAKPRASSLGPPPSIQAPTVTTPANPAQTVIPATPPAETTTAQRTPTPAKPAPGSTTTPHNGTGARFRDQYRPTRPRRNTLLSEEEWAVMDNWIDEGLRDFEIGKRMGRSEATVKKRRLERNRLRAQRNGNERVARQ